MTNWNPALHPRGNTGKFAGKIASPPAGALTSTDRAADACSECGATPAPYRLGNIDRGYRDPNEGHFCPAHAAERAADGFAIEEEPKPQKLDEELRWLVAGDDHEYELVTATSADAAIEWAAESFASRYDESYSADNCEVIAGFRGDSTWAEDLKWVPGTGATENDAYSTIDNSGL